MAPAVDWKTNPPRVDTGTTIETGAGWQAGDAGGPFTFDRNKPQINWTATYFLPEKAGSHDFKFGYEYANDQSKFANNGASGPILYRDLNGSVSRIRLPIWARSNRSAPLDRSRRSHQKHALFFQDRWSPVPRLTMTLGVRWEQQEPHYEASIRQPVQTEVFPNVTVPAATLVTTNKLVPRLGFSYDLVGNGKSVVKGFFGRYYYNFADRLSNLNPGGTNRNDYQFLDPNRNRIYDGLPSWARWSGAGGSGTVIDPDLKTPCADELSVSFERQFWGEASLRTAYVQDGAR